MALTLSAASFSAGDWKGEVAGQLPLFASVLLQSQLPYPIPPCSHLTLTLAVSLPELTAVEVSAEVAETAEISES